MKGEELMDREREGWREGRKGEEGGMDEQIDGVMNRGGREGCMDGWTNRWRDVHIGVRMDEWREGESNGGWMEGQMEGEKAEWMDGLIHGRRDG